MIDDLISRKSVIEAVDIGNLHRGIVGALQSIISELPPAQSEPLTDKEYRIFLAAMAREEQVCKEIDAEMTREPYEDSLVMVCREIKRKVKKALWTN